MLAAQGAKAKGYCVDVTQSSELSGLIRRAVEEHERIDILVNSQGITMLKPAEEFSRSNYDLLIATESTKCLLRLH